MIDCLELLNINKWTVQIGNYVSIIEMKTFEMKAWIKNKNMDTTDSIVGTNKYTHKKRSRQTHNLHIINFQLNVRYYFSLQSVWVDFAAGGQIADLRSNVDCCCCIFILGKCVTRVWCYYTFLWFRWWATNFVNTWTHPSLRALSAECSSSNETTPYFFFYSRFVHK